MIRKKLFKNKALLPKKRTKQ